MTEEGRTTVTIVVGNGGRRRGKLPIVRAEKGGGGAQRLLRRPSARNSSARVRTEVAEPVGARLVAFVSSEWMQGLSFDGGNLRTVFC